MRPVWLALAAAALAVWAAPPASAQSVALPNAETPNSPGSIVVPYAISTPPAVPEQRSYAELLALWQRAGAAYGIPWEVLAAINKIESDYGRSMGPSSAGAVGWMQFLPSTWMRWGLDGNGDGVANPWTPEDAVYAAARYLASAGGRANIARALFAYNHAHWYVKDVLELASLFAGGEGFDPTLGTATALGGPQLVFQVDEVGERIKDARRAVRTARRRVAAAEDRLAEFDIVVFEAEQRAGNPEISDAEFLRREARVTRLVRAQERALLALSRRRAELGEAVEHLESLRVEAEAQASTVTFSRPLVSGGPAPQFSGEYVFPVGGGPALVSVPAYHHDYPAADISAPAGAPLYALAAAVVVETWPIPTRRCGIGFEMRLADGRTYLYCHLSYLEPTIVPGATLAAGAPVGLVGATGNATGPHLHLQLIPARWYPQQESWFQSFANVAFRWEGDPPAPTAQARSLAQAEGEIVTFTP